MDEDLLSPEFGRLIDAAKAAARAADAAGTARAAADAAGTVGHRAEGWALLGADGEVHSASDLASLRAAAPNARTTAADRAGETPEWVAGAFAVSGETGDTLLPRGDWRREAKGLDPELPVAVKYLGRWVAMTLAEIPAP